MISWGNPQKCVMWSHSDPDLWPQNSNQSILESKWPFVPNVTKYPQVVPEISHWQEWDGGTTGKIIPRATAVSISSIITCVAWNTISSVTGRHDPTVSHNQQVLRLVYPPTGAAGAGAAPDLFQGPDTLSPLTRMISPSSPTSSFSYSSSSFSSLHSQTTMWSLGCFYKLLHKLRMVKMKTCILYLKIYIEFSNGSFSAVFFQYCERITPQFLYNSLIKWTWWPFHPCWNAEKTSDLESDLLYHYTMNLPHNQCSYIKSMCLSAEKL